MGNALTSSATPANAECMGKVQASRSTDVMDVSPGRSLPSAQQTSVPSLHVAPPSYDGSGFHGGPPEFLAELRDLLTLSTDAITIKFPIFTGTQMVSFTWYKDDQPISDCRYVASDGPTFTSLSIKRTEVRDAGRFTVKAANKYGSVITSCNLIVLDISQSKAIVNNSRVAICNAAINIADILPYFKQYRVLTLEQQNRIMAMKTCSQQADALIDCVLEGPAENGRVLLYALRMTGRDDLVDAILREGTGIQAVDDTWGPIDSQELVYDPSKYDILDEDQFNEYMSDGLSEKRIREKDKKLKEKIDAVLKNFYLPQNKSVLAGRVVSDLNIVFIGKTGVGKSASANTFIGQEVFEKRKAAKSVTQSVGVHDFRMDNRNIRVVDTPGLVDTDVAPEVTALELAKVLDVCPDGVHAFLYLHDATNYRFTEEQQRVKEQVMHIFGSDILKHTAMVLTHADGVFKKCSLREYLDHDIKDSLLEPFIKEELNNHIVAIDNEVDTKYERNFMRQALLEITDKVVSHVDNKIYTHEMFTLAARLRDQSESARCQQLAKLQKTDQEFFREAFKLARDKAHLLAGDYFKGKSLLEVRMERENNLQFAIEYLEKELRSALWRSDSVVLRQLENLHSDTSCPMRDIIEESINTCMCAHIMKQARRENNDAQMKRCKLILDLHDLARKITKRRYKRSVSENDYQPSEVGIGIDVVLDDEDEVNDDGLLGTDHSVTEAPSAAATTHTTHITPEDGAVTANTNRRDGHALLQSIDRVTEQVADVIRRQFLEKISPEEKSILNREEIEMEIALLTRHATMERRYEALIKTYLAEVDRAIWEEIQIHVRQLTYYEWIQIGDKDFNQVYIQVAHKISPGAVKYFSESRIKEEIAKQTLNKKDNLEKLVMCISNMIRSVIKQVFTACSVM